MMNTNGATTELGQLVRQIQEQLADAGHGGATPNPPATELLASQGDGLSEDDRNWLAWKQHFQRDPTTALRDLAQAFGVEFPHAERSFSETDSDYEEEENPLEYIDEYTRKGVERLVQQLIQPYAEQLQTLASAAQMFYAEQLRNAAAEQLRQLHAQDAAIVGDLTDNDIQQIVQLAAEKFNWNLEDAYNYWLAPRYRARLQSAAQPREATPSAPVGQLAPGDILRALVAEKQGG